MAGLQKILLVEDNTQLSEMYSFILRDHGYEVDVAYDGEQALVVAQSFQPDLIFLDIMMPKLDGFEVLKRLRHDPQYNCTKARIILLTNLSSESSASENWHDDADGYVIKAEIVPTDLIDIIKSFEANHPAPITPASPPPDPTTA